MSYGWAATLFAIVALGLGLFAGALQKSIKEDGPKWPAGLPDSAARFLACCVLAVFGLPGFLQLFVKPEYQLLRFGDLWMGAAWLNLLVVPIVFLFWRKLLNGRFHGWQTFGAAAILMICAGLPTGFAIIPWVNGRFDSGPPVTRRLEILSAETYWGRSGGSRHELIVPDSRKGQGREELIVHGDAFRRAEPGDTLLLTVKPGRLGYEWKVAYELVPRADPREAARAAQDAGDAELEQSLRQAADADPRSFEAALKLGALFVRNERWTDAVGIWSAYLALENQDGRAYYHRASARRGQGDMPGALEDLDSACRLGEKKACDLATPK